MRLEIRRYFREGGKLQLVTCNVLAIAIVTNLLKFILKRGTIAVHFKLINSALSELLCTHTLQSLMFQRLYFGGCIK